VYRLLGVDARSGAVRGIVDETAKTVIAWTAKTWRHWLDDSGELLWMSERDGWCHLYLYDVATGRVKNPVTRGDWVVRRVERVDAAARQVWFHAGGIRPGQDPYQLHFCRVNFDGTGLVVLTEGDGQHQVEFSPDRRWFIDTWSRVDLPPVVELRRSADGSRVRELERADASALLAAGWTLPERFVAKARDGRTDIFGILVRPSHLEPGRKYPVLEEVYAGPQAAYVPKEFGRLLRAHMLAELGFVVVQVDGMGTSQRSKAFQDLCFKDLADAGFANEPTPLSAVGLRLDVSAAKLASLDAFKAGQFEVQDEGSQIAAFLLGAEPRQTVVDYCAGGGGKTLAIGQMMRGQGSLVACDLNPRRLDAIKPRLERAHLSADLRRVGPTGDKLDDLIGKADRVLVDAPCSGSGTWRRRPEEAWRLTEAQLHAVIKTQKDILGRAAALVRPGGRLAYITCSVLAAENADVVTAFAANHPEFKPLAITEAASTPLLTDTARTRLAELSGGGHTVQLSPRRTGTDGFFIALFQRTS
jgi:16S rRNA C967 or C1407 C5-methylase (RsmB/RsmF family)